jgi:gluconolactonase
MADLEVRDERIHSVVDESPLVKRAGEFKFLEGPVWTSSHTVIFSDIAGNKMYQFDPASERVEVYRDPSNMANGNVFDHQGRLITCEHATSRVVREELDGSMTVLADEYEGAELNSPNDVVIDQRGFVFFTDPPSGRMEFWGIPRPIPQPVQGVYRIDPGNGTLVRLIDDFDLPNGLCFVENETALLVNDTNRMHIRRFEVKDSALTGGDVWAEVTGNGSGVPDGMKIDSVGNVFCCGPGGVHIFDSSGTSLGVILVPEDVANFNWGDDDLKTLYITAFTGFYSCRLHIPGVANTR